MILLDCSGVIDADGIVKFCSKIGITPDVYIFINRMENSLHYYII